MHTSYGSYTRGTTTTWEECQNVDSNLDLDLTDEQRDAMNEESARALEAEIQKHLPEGFTVLGNGEIIGPVGQELDLEAVREAVDGSDWWDPILAKYFELSA